jgi:hypothetical protein
MEGQIREQTGGTGDDARLTELHEEDQEEIQTKCKKN